LAALRLIVGLRLCLVVGVGLRLRLIVGVGLRLLFVCLRENRR
jgi:hypothetical protein